MEESQKKLRQKENVKKVKKGGRGVIIEGKDAEVEKE